MPCSIVVQSSVLGGVVVLSDEVASTHWVPLSELFDSAHTASLTLQHTGQTLRFPSIEVRKLTIWGLTLRMLRNFESLTTAPPTSK